MILDNHQLGANSATRFSTLCNSGYHRNFQPLMDFIPPVMVFDYIKWKK
jgi:hypothetical protein